MMLGRTGWHSMATFQGRGRERLVQWKDAHVDAGVI